MNLGVTQSGGDFTLAPQQSEITVQSGGSGTVGLNLASSGTFNGVVTLTCTPSSSQITCGVNPSTPTVNGSATATLTVTATAQAAMMATRRDYGNRLAWLGAEGSFLLAAIVLCGSMNRRCRLATLLGMLMLATLVAATGCGGGNSSGQQTPPPPPPSTTTYGVVVSATANGIIHNVKVLVVVR